MIYEKRNVRLIHGDSRDVLKTFPDGYFDAIITDPPYGIEFDKYDGEDAGELLFELEDELFRILKKGGWFVFWWTTKRIPDVARFRRFAYRWLLIAQFNGTRSKCIVGDRMYAPIFIFSKGDTKPATKVSEVLPARELPQLEGRKIKQGDFKPTYTQALLLNMFAGNGAVLDPFAGFGSLLLASLLTGIGKVIGVEKDRQRFEIAKRLLEEETVSMPLPDMMEGKNEPDAFSLWGLA